MARQMMMPQMMQFYLYIQILQTQESPILMLQIILIFSLFFLIQSHFVQLFRIDTTIDNDCWVINTSNQTEMSMGNCHDEVYYIRLGLGTPSQFFNFQIDLFHDLIWFPLNGTFQNMSDTFEISNKKSVTYINKRLIEGSIGSDIVSIPDTAISTRSSIVWAHKKLNFSFEYLDGVLGLGFSSTPNFLDNAASSNQINSSVFSLQMGTMDKPSILYYNRLPDFLQQSNIYNPVTSPQFWEVSVPNVKVGSFDYSYVAAKKMILDTSTSIIHLNPLLFQKIFSRFFSDCAIDVNNRPICPCRDDRPIITFVLENVQLTVDPQSYTRYQKDKCLLLLGVTAQQESPMLIGSSLMKNYIITFDKSNAQIGFNGSAIGVWRQLFIIFEFVMLCLALIVVGVGIYQLVTVKYIKKSVKQNLNKKLLQLSTKFLQA